MIQDDTVMQTWFSHKKREIIGVISLSIKGLKLHLWKVLSTYFNIWCAIINSQMSREWAVYDSCDYWGLRRKNAGWKCPLTGREVTLMQQWLDVWGVWLWCQVDPSALTHQQHKSTNSEESLEFYPDTCQPTSDPDLFVWNCSFESSKLISGPNKYSFGNNLSYCKLWHTVARCNTIQAAK